MLSATVQAIQGHAGAAGQPSAAMTAMLGMPAPMTSAAMAALESRRDFTHAVQTACREALASIAPKTTMSKGEVLRARVTLQEALRVDVDGDLGAAARFRRARHPAAQVGLQVDLALRLDEQAEAIAAADQHDGRLGRAEHRHA